MKNKDLILISLNAHLNYMLPRIYDDNKAYWFYQRLRHLMMYTEEDRNDSINIFLEKFDEKHSGINLAIDVYKQVCDNVVSRFETGYNREGAVEKL